MSPGKRQTSPQAAQEIADHAREHLRCDDCGAAPGERCDQADGRIVCRSRYIAAAIAVKRQARETRQVPDQAAGRAAVLASLPRVPKAEIEKCRTPRGGYSFTKAWFLEHGLPYPPIAGWRQAVAIKAACAGREQPEIPPSWIVPSGLPNPRLPGVGPLPGP